MPFKNEHAARIESPDKYDDFKRDDNHFAEGIHAILGIIKEDSGRTQELQSIRFDTESYTAKEAKAWLKENDIDAIIFEPAKASAAKGKKPSAKGKGETVTEGEAKKLETFTLDAVEVFDTGTWNYHQFVEADIDELAKETNAAIDAGHIIPFVKLGHNDEQPFMDGDPSLGWIDKVWKKGTKLYAKISGVPKKLYDLVLVGAYRKVSVEIMFDAIFDEKRYGKVISDLAFLGADLPAVDTLDDIAALYQASYDAKLNARPRLSGGRVHVFTWDCQTEADDKEKHEMNEKVKELESQVSEFKKQTEDETKRADEANERAKTAEATMLKMKRDAEVAEVDVFIKTLTDGESPKLPPAYTDTVKGVLLNLDGTKKATFSKEGKPYEDTPRKALMSVLEGLASVITFTEKAHNEVADEREADDKTAERRAEKQNRRFKKA